MTTEIDPPMDVLVLLNPTLEMLREHLKDRPLYAATILLTEDVAPTWREAFVGTEFFKVAVNAVSGLTDSPEVNVEDAFKKMHYDHWKVLTTLNKDGKEVTGVVPPLTVKSRQIATIQ